MAVVFPVVLWITTSQADTLVPAPVFNQTPEDNFTANPVLPEELRYLPLPAPVRKNIGVNFNGEKLHYTVSFLLFFHAADANITFTKDTAVKNGYIAELEGHTSGIIKILTFQRRDRYISHMVMMDNGKRLRSAKFEKVSKQGGRKTKRSETVFDYENKIVHWKVWKGDELAGEGSRPIPENTVYDDPLSAFYNFRYGVYGDIQKGKPIEVKSVPTTRESKIELLIASEEETQKKNNVSSKKSSREYLVKVLMDKDVFDQTKGNIELWLSKDFVPVEGVVKGVVLVGDIHGVLRPDKENKPQSG